MQVRPCVTVSLWYSLGSSAHIVPLLCVAKGHGILGGNKINEQKPFCQFLLAVRLDARAIIELDILGLWCLAKIFGKTIRNGWLAGVFHLFCISSAPNWKLSYYLPWTSIISLQFAPHRLADCHLVRLTTGMGLPPPGGRSERQTYMWWCHAINQTWALHKGKVPMFYPTEASSVGI